MLRCSFLVAIIAVAVSHAAAPCSFSEFQCKDDKQRICGNVRCDGFINCSDGSDEEGCDEAFSKVALPPNTTTTAVVHFKEENGSMDILLCGTNSCSKVWLWGVRDNGTMRYYTFTQCNHIGLNCRLHEAERGEGVKFTPGEVVLEVQHQSDEVAVWRQGHPDSVAKVPVKANSTMLIIMPFDRSTYMPVDFIGNIRRMPHDQVAAHLKVGSRVAQNWDMNPTPKTWGTVTKNYGDSVRVQWPDGGTFYYYMGKEGQYHLTLLEVSSSLTTDSPVTTGRPTTTSSAAPNVDPEDDISEDTYDDIFEMLKTIKHRLSSDAPVKTTGRPAATTGSRVPAVGLQNIVYATTGRPGTTGSLAATGFPSTTTATTNFPTDSPASISDDRPYLKTNTIEKGLKGRNTLTISQYNLVNKRLKKVFQDHMQTKN